MNKGQTTYVLLANLFTTTTKCCK